VSRIIESRGEVGGMAFSGRFSGRDGHVVVVVVILFGFFGREDDDRAAGEVAAVGGDDLRSVFGDDDGRFDFPGFGGCFRRNLLVFSVFRDWGRKREFFVDEDQALFQLADGTLEAGDLAVELGEDVVAGEHFGDGEAHDVHFVELGQEGVGPLAGVDDGLVPDDGDVVLEAIDLPAGSGDVAEDGHGLRVDGFVDGDEIVDEEAVLVAVLVAETAGWVGT